MTPFKRTSCLLFVAWIFASADAVEVRRPAGQRARSARCQRLDLDLWHGCDFTHHPLEQDDHSLAAVVPGIAPGSALAPAFDPRLATAPEREPAVPEAVIFRGRAPPASM
jgi:hypothetical protein